MSTRLNEVGVAPAGVSGGQYTVNPNSAAAVELDEDHLPAETQRRLRGHDFYPKDVHTWPKMYSGEDLNDFGKTEIVAHYFLGNMDWYISEMRSDGVAFGYAKFGQNGEWGGGIYLPELEQARKGYMVIERDIHFRPGTLAKNCIDGWGYTPNIVDKLNPSAKIPALDPAQLAVRHELRNDLLGLDSGPGGWSDALVDSVKNGQLSRGTAGTQGAEALMAWRILAATEAVGTDDIRFIEFKEGLEKGVVALMASKIDFLGAIPDGGIELERFAQQATQLAQTKRASADDREEWRQKLQHAKSDAEYRGMLVAGAALSGTDSWWGFRDDTTCTILG